MSKVIQIRGVPDDVHGALEEAARAEGLSLTRFLLRELGQVAGRAQAVRHNAEVVRRAQREIGGRADRDTILSALHEGRRE